MKIIPTNDWLVKDTQKSIREKSIPAKMPLSKEDVLTMKKLIEYVKDSVNPKKNADKHLRPAVGLAAPQIGVNKRMAYIYFRAFDEEGKEHLFEHALVNPEILGVSKEVACLEHGEGCLSVDGEHPGISPRHVAIKVKFYDYILQKEIIKEAYGYEAIVFQHEIDHLNGVLFYDHQNKKDPWYKSEDWYSI